MITRSHGSVLISYILPKKEPEFAATDSGGGNSGAGDDYTCNNGIDTDGSYNYGSPQDGPESKVINVYYHPIKEEPEPEFGHGDGDATVVNGNGDCDPPKEESELVATADDADADSGPDVGYDCSHCGIGLCTEKFKAEHELRCKVRMEQKELESQVTKLYHCGHCRCPFVNEEYKEQHQRKWCRKRPVAKKKPSNDPYFRCDKCKFVTNWRGNLEKHHVKHIKETTEWFVCTQCSYKTVRKYDMNGHMKIHSNTFSCCCPICGKSFRTKRCLDHHLLRLHSDEWDEVSELVTSKVYTCDICDRYRTTKKMEFNEHLAVIHLEGVGRQKYECPCCPFSTFSKFTLKIHSKRHGEQKDYRCAVCKKQFTRKHSLDSHVLHNHADNVDFMKTITSKIHRCQSCSYKTVHKTTLKRHIQSKHV